MTNKMTLKPRITSVDLGPSAHFTAEPEALTISFPDSHLLVFGFVLTAQVWAGDVGVWPARGVFVGREGELSRPESALADRSRPVQRFTMPRFAHGSVATPKQLQDAQRDLTSRTTDVDLGFAVAGPAAPQDYDFLFPELQHDRANLLPRSADTPQTRQGTRPDHARSRRRRQSRSPAAPRHA
jgi:hypothetical protein